EELRQMLRAAGQATPTQSNRQTQGDPLAATLKMNSEMLVAPMTDAGRVAQTGAAVSEVTAPQPTHTAPEIKTTPENRQTVPPVVNTLPPTQTTQPAAQPPKQRRTGRTVAWVVASLGLIVIIGLVSFVALAIYVSSQQQTTDDSSTNTRPAENNNRSEANLNRDSAENNSRTSAENVNTGSANTDTDRVVNSNNSNSTANSNANSPEEYVANPSDVHIDALYMADSPDGTATTSFSPTDHTVYAITKLNKIARGAQVRFTWIAVDVAGEQQGSKIRDVDYTMGTNENIVKAHLTLPQDWPAGQYKVEVYINGNLEQTIDYTVE
ncbi:MAG TPA: hypothetical protein VE821_03465, partial [Pyrinomonadaceae bacterium]|nr:hypothetical protein [Pyrinomonadaceae bacterium]